MLYGRDPCLPIELALNIPTTPYLIGLDECNAKMTCKLPDAWNAAQKSIRNAQMLQKEQCVSIVGNLKNLQSY